MYFGIFALALPNKKEIVVVEYADNTIFNPKDNTIKVTSVSDVNIEYVKTKDELAFEELDGVTEYIDWIDKYYEVHEKYGLTTTLLEEAFDNSELMYLYRTVETETYQADFLSKVHVANVVFNRLETGIWGDTIKQVVTKPSQFDYHRTIISEDTIKAVRYAYIVGDLTEGALFFDNNMSLYSMYDITYIFTDICGHNFFKFK